MPQSFYVIRKQYYQHSGLLFLLKISSYKNQRCKLLQILSAYPSQDFLSFNPPKNYFIATVRSCFLTSLN
jgi:hypothetical protein